MQFTFNLLQMTQTQEIIICRVLKTQEWIQGDVDEWGKFLRNDKRQIKLLSKIFFTIHILHFINDPNSRNNNSQGSKIHEWIWGMCKIGGKFLKE